MNELINWLLDSYNWLMIVGVVAFVGSAVYTAWMVRRVDFR